MRQKKKPGKQGRLVMGLADLADLAREKRSVVVPGTGAWEKPRPAAFLFNLPGRVLYNDFLRGMYVWERAEHGPSKPPVAVERKEQG